MKQRVNIIISTIIFLALLAISNVSVFAGEICNADVKVEYKQSDARSILTMINDMRSSSDAWYWNEDDASKTVLSNLDDLTYDYSLEKVAMQRAAEIAVSYSHTRTDNTPCFTALSEGGISFYTAGENIAAGYTTPRAVNAGWREDNDNYSGQGHRRNMLSEAFNSVGIACVSLNGIKYWVEEFAYIPDPDTSATPANDKLTNVTLGVSTDIISSVKLSCAKSRNIELNKKALLPAVTATLETKNFWGYAAPTVTPHCSYAISNESIASIENGKIKPKKIGKTVLTVSAFGKERKVTIKVTPKGTSLRSLKAGKKSFTATWKKQSTQTTGYMVRYSLKKNMSKAKTVTISKNTKVKTTVKKLSSKKKYYVQVATYKRIGKVNYVSPWSKAKTVRTK